MDKITRIYRIMGLIRIIAVLAVLVVQTASVVHATEFGDDVHSHDGVECVLSKATDRSDDDLIVPSVLAFVLLPRLESATEDFRATALLIPTVTASPPGRAPPLS